MEILVVEDEAGIADFLERGLGAEGYGVRVAGDGIVGEEMAMEREVGLVVLDRMLPGRDGIEVLKAIRRARPALPVILLTARARSPTGSRGSTSAPPTTSPSRSPSRSCWRGFGPTCDTPAAGPRRRSPPPGSDSTWSAARRRGASEVRLPEREAALLGHLMRHAGRVCTREEILAAVWGYEHDPGTNVVQVYIGYLRRKLDLPDSPAPIETVRSVGYRLRDSG